MPSTTVMLSIGILVVSFLAGFLFYYLLGNEPKKIKKKRLESLLSMLINFIIFIWIGKIVVNISVFIQDPLAILAYPSNTKAFYVAIVLIAINIYYNIRKNEQNGKDLFHTFVPVFLASSFIYEFAELITSGSRQGGLQLTLLMILLLVYTLAQGKTNRTIADIGVLFLWLLGQFILSFVVSYTTIFGYMVSPWFYIVLSMLVFIYIVVSRKKGKV